VTVLMAVSWVKILDFRENLLDKAQMDLGQLQTVYHELANTRAMNGVGRGEILFEPLHRHQKFQ